MTADDEKLLDDIADGLVARRLATPALFVLESMRPLTFVGSQLMIVMRPMIVLVAGGRRWDQIQKLLEERESVEQLARRLEARM